MIAWIKRRGNCAANYALHLETLKQIYYFSCIQTELLWKKAHDEMVGKNFKKEEFGTIKGSKMLQFLLLSYLF